MGDGMIVIDGTNAVLGRLGSRVAKELLKGETVMIINADKMIISGNPKNIIDKYLIRRQIKTKQRPELKPRYPRSPDRFVKRLIRGMLPYRSARGRAAYKRLKVYMEPPEEIKDVQPIKIPEAENKGIRKYITVLELCRRLGYNG